jgi:hypothetical protein
MKSQKERYLRMLENIHHLLCAILGICLKPERVVSPKVLDHIAEFAQYAHYHVLTAPINTSTPQNSAEIAFLPQITAGPWQNQTSI